MPTLTPCLLTGNIIQEILDFYKSVFKSYKLESTLIHGEHGHGKPGDLLSANVEIEGQRLMLLYGGDSVAPPGPGFSFLVTVETQEEIDYYWEKLGAGGKPMQCGWLTDRFGICWQIAPAKLLQMIQDQDQVKADRTMQCMMTMIKIDLPTLERAYAGK